MAPTERDSHLPAVDVIPIDSMTSENKKPGRPKGATNKVSAQVKENILCVFNRLEGTAGMAVWAKNNPTEFYRIYARMLPKEIDATIDDKREVSRAELEAQLAALGIDPEQVRSGRSIN